MTTIQSVSLFFKDGGSDKEYNVTLDEVATGQYKVNATYGRRGNAVNSTTKTPKPVDMQTAMKVYNKLVQEKQRGGYVPGANGTVVKPFSAVQDRESTYIFPQLLTPVDEDEMEKYITDDNYWAQEKLDGKRIIAQIENGSVTASNRKSLVCGIPSEIEQGLQSIDTGTILDGEMIGEKYYVFDVLQFAMNDITSASYENRYDILAGALLKSSGRNIVLVPCAKSTQEKRTLVESLRHKEGVVFKLRSAPYTAGKNSTQIKCKFWSDVSLQVTKVNDKASVQIGIMNNGQITIVGNVTTNGHEQPQVGDIVDVTYLYAYPGGSLYQPKYRGKRDDHDVDDISVLKYKSEDTDD